MFYKRVMLFATPLSQIVICDTGVANKPLICETTLRWRQTPQIVSKLPRVCRHGVRLPLKLSLSQNGPVLEEVCGILGQPKNVQTVSQIWYLRRGVANKPLICVTALSSRQTTQIDS